MGLDMYLYKKTYVKQWDHIKPEEQFQVSVKRGGKAYKAINPKLICYITEEVGYWRKFNALHNWIIANCADHVDDCKDVYVEMSSMEDLLTILHNVQLHNEDADRLFPTTEGFFFGGTEYGEYYFEQVSETIELLERLIQEPGDYYYRASW
jgi:hypothetical protein